MSIETELLQVKGSKELLLAEDVETWAKKHPKSELFQQLEWNDAEAGHQYRLWQIRRLIAIHISYEPDGGRRMVSLTIDRTNPGGGYRDIDDVLKTQKLYDIMLHDALVELERLQNKYERIKELEPVWQAVKKTRQRKAA